MKLRPSSSLEALLYVSEYIQPASGQGRSQMQESWSGLCPKTCCGVETAHPRPGRREVLFQDEPIWSGGLSWKQPGKGKGVVLFVLTIEEEQGEKKEGGDSRRDSTVKERREECIKSQRLEEK